MECITVITGCQLCGKPFEERVCSHGHGWTREEDHPRHPFEDGMPWCQVCRERISRTCESLLDGINLDPVVGTENRPDEATTPAAHIEE